MVDLIEYRPTHVKLPAGLAKDLTDYPDQQRFQQHNAGYDADSLFYDVFYDIRRANIWTTGPPLYSLAADFAKNLQIFGNGELLQYEMRRESHSSCSLRIPVTSAQRNLTELEFVLGDVSFKCRVARFPKTKKPTQPTMSVIQKDYEPEHVIDWLLWHYRLYGYRRFLLYDNGSANVAVLTDRLRALAAPLNIVLVHWRYYWGHRLAPNTDAFAQYTQLNHTHMLHYGMRTLITNWDMDEYLVCQSRLALRLLSSWRMYNLPRYDGLGDGARGLAGCTKIVSGGYREHGEGKFFYVSNALALIENVHLATKPTKLSGLARVRGKLALLGAQVGLRVMSYLGVSASVYIMHAQYLRKNWRGLSPEHQEALRAKARERAGLDGLYEQFLACLARAKLTE